MKIVVASKNPIKIKAVENAMKKIYDDAEIISVDVDSGVSHTPLTDEELIKGAVSRAKKVIQSSDAEIAVGMEGGIAKRGENYFLSSWVAIVDRKGDVSIGQGGGVQLPEVIMNKVMKGKELGPAGDEVLGIDNIKQKIGVSGFLTSNLTSRQEIWEDTIIFAMAKRLHPDLYKNE